MRGYRLRALNLLGSTSIQDLVSKFGEKYPDQDGAPCKVTVITGNPLEVEFVFSDAVSAKDERTGFEMKFTETPEYAIKQFVNVILMKKHYRCKHKRDYDMWVIP